MTKYVTAIMLAISMYSAAAQNSLSGKISSKADGTPLPASVFIHDLQKGTSADIEGLYKIENLPTGKFLVEVRLVGYNSQIKSIIINGNTTLNFDLEEAVTELNDVVVTGVSKATEIRQNPVPALIMPRQELLQAASANIIDAISRQPGISQVSTGAAISKPVIRGLGYNRVVTLNNGLRQEGQQWGDEHGIEIDEYSIDRAEVIKGPGSLMYGSDAMAGVINFLAPKPVDEGKITGEVLANYQTNNGLFGWSAMNAGNLKGINWLARISGKNAAAYRNAYDGRVFNSGFNERDFNATLGINRKWGYSRLTFSSFNQNIGMVEGDRDSLGNFVKAVAINDSTVEEQTVTSSDLKDYKLNVPRQQINHNRMAWQNLFILGKSSLSIDLSWQQNQRREYGDPLAPNQYGPYFLLRTTTYSIKYNLPEMKGWESTIGAGGMYQTNQNKGIEFLIPAYHLFDFGVFALTKKSFGKRLTVSGGLRYDARILNAESLYLNADGQPVDATNPSAGQKFTAFKRNFNNITGSLGSTYNFSEKLLGKLNVSKGFRAPNAAELGSNGKHEGTLRYEYGNNALKPETSIQFDAGADYESKHFTLEVSVFQNFIQQFIYAERLSSTMGGDSIADPTDPVPSYLYRQGNASLSGGEISVDIHPHPLDWLHFENSFSYVQGSLTHKGDSSRYLPFMPPAHYRSELRGSFKKMGKCLRSAYLSLQYDYYFAQNKVLLENSTETPTPAYGLLNAGAGATVVNKKGNTLFNIFITATNLLDAAYQSHLSRLKYAAVNSITGRTGVFNMGRNISVKVTVPLVFKR